MRLRCCIASYAFDTIWARRSLSGKPTFVMRSVTKRVTTKVTRMAGIARSKWETSGNSVEAFIMKGSLSAIVTLLAAVPAFAQLPKNLPPALPLWDKGAPGSEKRIAEAEEVQATNVSNVHNPTI